MAVYTIVTSMGFESEEKVRSAVFQPYQVNAELMSLLRRTQSSCTVFRHTRREVTPEVLDGPQSVSSTNPKTNVRAEGHPAYSVSSLAMLFIVSHGISL